MRFRVALAGTAIITVVTLGLYNNLNATEPLTPSTLDSVATHGEAVRTSVPTPWRHEGVGIKPNCFTTYWNSGDNYETFADHYGFGEYGDAEYDEFVINPASFIGKEIPVDAVLDPWSPSPPIYLSPSLSECHNFEDRLGPMKYEAYGVYDLAKCGELTAHIDGTCVGMKLVKVDGPFGYSNIQSHTALYALIDSGETGLTHVVPLINFKSFDGGVQGTSQLLTPAESN